jgi:hypothetical protein
MDLSKAIEQNLNDRDANAAKVADVHLEITSKLAAHIQAECEMRDGIQAFALANELTGMAINAARTGHASKGQPLPEHILGQFVEIQKQSIYDALAQSVTQGHIMAQGKAQRRANGQA